MTVFKFIKEKSSGISGSVATISFTVTICFRVGDPSDVMAVLGGDPVAVLGGKPDAVLGGDPGVDGTPDFDGE